jgi:hypothetical protein
MQVKHNQARPHCTSHVVSRNEPVLNTSAFTFKPYRASFANYVFIDDTPKIGLEGCRIKAKALWLCRGIQKLGPLALVIT